MQPSSLRAFVSIAPDDHLVPALAAIQAELRSLPGGEQVRWSQPDQIHLTLRFLGGIALDQSDLVIQQLREICANHQPFALEIAELGCFPGSHRPRVIWLGLRGAIGALLALQRDVTTALGAFGDHLETRTFHPHLTLGRVPQNARRLDLVVPPTSKTANLGPWLVKSVLLMRSELHPQGARHSVLFEQTFPHVAR
jgi:RNA 2',3'-cyclic 3'-phosphodiesterase